MISSRIVNRASAEKEKTVHQERSFSFVLSCISEGGYRGSQRPLKRAPSSTINVRAETAPVTSAV
jgi:hypothetical protein